MDHGGETRICFVAAHGHALELLQLAEEVLDQVSPLIDIEVYVERRATLWPLRDHHLRAALVQLRDDPVGVERFVSNETAELDVFDQRFHANRVVALTWQQDEPYEIAQRVGQRQDLGRQATARLANGLALSPLLRPGHGGGPERSWHRPSHIPC